MTYYILDYKNGNKRIEEKEIIRQEERNFILTESYTAQEIKDIKINLAEDGISFDDWLQCKINENLAPYLVGIIESNVKPDWDDLEYDVETSEYRLKELETTNAEAVYNYILKKYTESDIVSAAMRGFRNGYRSGYAVFDRLNYTIYSRSLGTSEYYKVMNAIDDKNIKIAYMNQQNEDIVLKEIQEFFNRR